MGFLTTPLTISERTFHVHLFAYPQYALDHERDVTRISLGFYGAYHQLPYVLAKQNDLHARKSQTITERDCSRNSLYHLIIDQLIKC